MNILYNLLNRDVNIKNVIIPFPLTKIYKRNQAFFVRI